MVKKDRLWEHVVKENNRYMCKFCHSKFAGGIWRIRSHLAKLKGRNIKICEKVPDEVRCAALAAYCFREEARSPNNVEGSVNAVDQSMPEVGEEHKSAIHNMLATFIISNDISVDLIQSSSFVDFVKSVAEIGPSYQLPSSSSFQRKLVPDLEKEVTEYVAEVENSIAKTGCTLMYDNWYDKDGTYVHIFVCTPTGMLLARLQKASATTDVETILSPLIESLRPECVIQLLQLSYQFTDIFTYKHPAIMRNCCASYILEYLLVHICTEVQWMDDVLCLAKSVVAYLFKHNLNLSLGIRYGKSKECAGTGITECASRFLMLHTILENAKDLQELQLPFSSTSCTCCNSCTEVQLARHVKCVRDLNRIIHCDTFLTGVTEAFEVLQPLFQLLSLVDENRSTSGYLYEAWERAKDDINECLRENVEKYEPIRKALRDCQFILIRPLHKAAAFLNPGYMLSENFKGGTEIKEGIDYIFENMVTAEDKEDFLIQMERYRSKEARIFTTTAKLMLKTAHPRSWWEYCGDHVEVLKKYATRILSQPCSMSSCRQYRLLPTISKNHLFYVNTRLMEKYSLLGEEVEQLIDLDELAGFPEYEEDDNLHFADTVNKDWQDIMSDSSRYQAIIARWSLMFESARC